jgi:hypothetical protein
MTSNNYDLELVFSDTDNDEPTTNAIKETEVKGPGRPPGPSTKEKTEKQRETSRKNLEKARMAREAKKQQQIKEAQELEYYRKQNMTRTSRKQPKKQKSRQPVYDDYTDSDDSDYGEDYSEDMLHVPPNDINVQPFPAHVPDDDDFSPRPRRKRLTKSEEKMMIKMAKIEGLLSDLHQTKRSRGDVHKTVIVQPPYPQHPYQSAQQTGGYQSTINGLKKELTLDMF